MPHPEGGVQLATPIWGEAAIFAEAEGIGAGWDKAKEVKVPIGLVVAGDTAALGGDETVQEMVWRPPIVANEQFKGTSHLVSAFVCANDARHKLMTGGPRGS